MSRARLRVAICGGGIGGLALANVFRQYSDDVTVDIYEAAPQSNETGAGVMLFKRTWSILRDVGLDKALVKEGFSPPEDKPTPGVVLRKADQKEESRNFRRMISPSTSVSMHRVVLLDVLRKGVSSTFRMHFKKRLVTYHQCEAEIGAVTLFFDDGSSSHADVLIGADGINSATRRTLFASKPEHAFPTWTGLYAHRALINPSNLLQISPGHQATTTPVIYMGKGKHIVAYPISGGRMVNFLAYHTVSGGEGTVHEGPSVTEGDLDELSNLFENWEPKARCLVSCVEKSSKWAISQHRHTPCYVQGAVALLGDAAHAMAAHLGAGAGQAIEDAFILGRLLSSPSVNCNNVRDVLEIYQNVRLPLANDVVERTHITGLIYDLSYHPAFGCVDDETTEVELTERVLDSIYEQWTYRDGLPSDDWETAEGMLEGLRTKGDTKERRNTSLTSPLAQSASHL